MSPTDQEGRRRRTYTVQLSMQSLALMEGTAQTCGRHLKEAKIEPPQIFNLTYARVCHQLIDDLHGKERKDGLLPKAIHS